MDTSELKQQAELVSGCVAKNPLAQQKFYDRFAAVMYAICLRYTANSDDARDVLQDGFIQVFQNLDKFGNQGSLEGWVKRVIVNVALGKLRLDKRMMATDDVENAHHLAHQPQAESSLTHKEIMQQIQQLPAGCRTVFNLYVMEGYTHQQIAKELEITEGTSKSQLARARQLLQQKLANEWTTR